MRIVLTIFVLLFFYRDTLSQTYFNRSYGTNSPYDIGLSISVKDSTYLLFCDCDYNQNWRFDKTVIEIDKYGDSLSIRWFGTDSTSFQTANYGYIKVYDNYIYDCGRLVRFDSVYSDLVFMKREMSGDTLWIKTYNIENWEAVQSFIQTPDGGFMLGGFTQPYDGTTYGTARWFVIKTDSVGNEQWRKHNFGINGDLRQIIQTHDGNYVLAGWYGSGFNYAQQLVKIDASGNIIWQKRYSKTVAAALTGVHELLDSTFLIYGAQNEDPNNISKYYIGKTDKQGEILWEYTYGDNSNSNEIRNLELLPDGSFIACGQGSSQGTNSTLVRGTILKFCPNGELLWERKYGAVDFSSYLYDIELTPDGGFIATGSTRGKSGTQDLWVIKTDSLGCDTPGCAQIPAPCPEDTLSINNEKLTIDNGKLRVVPNPFTNEFKVESLKPLPKSLSEGEGLALYDLLGRVMDVEYQILNNEIIIDGSKLEKGVYIIEISPLWGDTEGRGVIRTKVVKQ